MTIETALVSRLSDLVTGRMYPQTLPEGVELPALRYTIVSRAYPKNAYGQNIPLHVSRAQIDCWADGYAGTVTLAQSVVERLDNYQGDEISMATVEGSRDLYDTQANLYRRIVEAQLWHQET